MSITTDPYELEFHYSQLCYTYGCSHDVSDQLQGIRGSASYGSNHSLDHTQPGLPEGWESAIDKDGRLYYINHKENVSTYNDPRNELDVEYEYADTRIIRLIRDTQLGFGFVAGSERPVVVRCVSEGGPSDKLLLPGDQIHKINSEDVREAPRSRVIELVRSAEEELVLTVSQPPTISTQGKKSILLNAAKKQQRLKRDSSASRVRFCEDSLNKKKRSSLLAVKGHEPSLASILKVHIEPNQTRSFKYDGFTLVKDVLNALKEKLDFRCIEPFGLVIHNVKSPLSAKMTILSPQEKIKQVVSQLTEDSMHCLFRIVYVPRDAYDLLRKDSIAFQYFYTQCCQDVINERFSSDLKCDVALRLASLHMQEHAIEKQIPFQKISIKLIEREFGLGEFLNPSMIQAVRPKELRKMLAHFMKLNQGLVAPGQKQVTPLQAKLHYMKIVTELRSFGGKCFLATLVDRRSEVMLFVGPKCGISQVTDIKSNALHMLADFDLIEVIRVKPEPSGATQLISVYLTDRNLPTLALSMMNTDAKDFLIFVQGYHQLFCGQADLVKYDSQSAGERAERGDMNGIGSQSPPGLRKMSGIDCNQNESVEPDYATIEEVLHPDGDPSDIREAPTTPAILQHNSIASTKSNRGHVSVANVLSTSLQSSQLLPESSEISTQFTSTNRVLQNAPEHTNGFSEHDYDVTPDEGDGTPPPMSCIDDIIIDSNGIDAPSLRGTSSMDGLAAECIDELCKLDGAGALLDPRMFKDKGLYLQANPSAALDLSILPPPPDERTVALNPLPVIAPPPALFTDNTDLANGRVHEETDREIGVQLGAVDALSAPDLGGDKESGIDSDDSGTETFNSTDNVSSSTFTASVPETNQAKAAATRLEVKPNHQVLMALPISPRVNIKQRGESIKPSVLNTSTEIRPLSITHNTISSSNEICPVIQGDLTATPSILEVNEENQNDIDLRMVDALMQFTHELSTDSEGSDVSDNEMPNNLSWEINGISKSLSSLPPLPPMMLSDSHLDVSTEEEDNGCLPASAEITLNNSEVSPSAFEPTYMNSEVEAPLLTKVPTEQDNVAANAIDEALDGLTSGSDSEEEPTAIGKSYKPKATLKDIVPERIPDADQVEKCGSHSATPCNPAIVVAPSSTRAISATPCIPAIVVEPSSTRAISGSLKINSHSSAEMPSKKVSATIVLTGALDDADSTLIENGEGPTPKPPPRRRRGMKSATSLASLSSVGERPPSRTSLATVSSLATNDDESPRSNIARGTSIESQNMNTNAKITGYVRSISSSSMFSEQSMDRLSVSDTSSIVSGQPSPRFARQYSDNPISQDLGLLRAKRSKKSKQDRAIRTASVIGMPTNITCTAGDVLANCVPIIRDDKSPRARKNSTSPSVTLTSREALLDDMLRNASSVGVHSLGITRTGDSVKNRSLARDSMRSTDSVSSSNSRPGAPPPPPPLSAHNSALKASRSEGDLLAATRLSLTAQSIDGNEAMLEIEYTVMDGKSTHGTRVGVTRQPSAKHTTTSTGSTGPLPSIPSVLPSADTAAAGSTGVSKSSDSARSATPTNSSRKPKIPTETRERSRTPTRTRGGPVTRAESALNRDSGLEKDGSFIKFSGYAGEPNLSPTLHRKGRFRKKNAPVSMVSDHMVGENPGKRGIMFKILNTIKPKKRSMSLDRLTVDTDRKLQGGSLKLSTTATRPSILPLGDKYSKSSRGFRSLGKTKFHSKPKLSRSLTDLVYEQSVGDDSIISPATDGRAHSIECLFDSQMSYPVSETIEPEAENLPTSGSKLTPSGILNYTYQPHNAFEEAVEHTQSLIEYFTAYCDTQWAPCLKPDPNNFTKIKETLVTDGRQFVSNSKQLVAGVTQAASPTDAILVSKMAASVRTLAKIVIEGVEALQVTASDYNMASLRECIVTVSEAYADVLQTSHKAAGKPMHDENMMVIMQKASHLASLLSLFLKTLRALREADNI